MDTTTKRWNTHYTRDASVLLYPDEQLVRMLSKHAANKARAIDVGCGTGRHIKLLYEFGCNYVVGIDISFNALVQSKKVLHADFVQAEIQNLPFGDSSFDIAVAWGSLHYAKKDMLPVMLHEIKRILAPHGVLFGTLRSENDTYIARGKHLGNNIWETDLTDIKGAVVSLYSLEEVKTYLNVFSEYHIGLMERTLLDDLTKKLSHWYFYAQV
ncbi:MAG: class I SAM-dependent methyltransferase [Spirochaetes bacterium]|nr:class I SAM-dependent methyltransferase [Spirochaetota bacterium]